MVSTALTASISGLDVNFITVEADVRNGLPAFQMVGYLSAEVKEAGERVRAAIQNSGFDLRPMKILINLSPAYLKKKGPAFDLSIAAAVMAAFGFIKEEKLKDTVILGELSLNGEVKGVTGVLPVVIEAKQKGYRCCIVPEENRREAEIIHGIDIWGVRTLSEMAGLINERKSAEKENSAAISKIKEKGQPFTGNEKSVELEDYEDIYGQETAKRAIEIAVAGGHNLLMIGPPGAGKSMLAERVPSILPPLSEKESIEISKIYSVCGLLGENCPMIVRRPFRRVHHSVTRSALVGGGGNPKPGEISLANGGVLFLDEFPEMDRRVMESLRQPLEERRIEITRSRGRYRFPADFQLFAAMNPCPCGNYPDQNRCRCTRAEIDRYLSKISRPLLERIDICIEVADVSYREITGNVKGRTSEDMRKGVIRAREIQKERYGAEAGRLNSTLKGKDVERYCALGVMERKFMELVFDKLHLSVRTYHNILKVARTIADLSGCRDIELAHLQEAAGYRMTDLRGGYHGISQ